MDNYYWDSFDCEIQSDELAEIYGDEDLWKEVLAEDLFN